MSESKSCDHCGAGPDEPCPVGCTCGEADTIARLTRERDAARAERAQLACEVSDLLIEVGRMTREMDEARAALARAYGCVTRNKAPDNPHQAAQGIIEEYRDVSNERDESEERAIQSRRWSRLWHREARRLWREVQALGAMLDDVQREVDPEQWMRDVGGDQ